jgi:DNA polymerase-3 subunit delta
MLADHIGTDIDRLFSELDKLAMLSDDGNITPLLIEQNIGISKDFNGFELQKALVEGDVVKANRIVNYFADNPKDHTIIKELPLLFRFFSNLLIYLYLPDKSDRVAAQALGISPFAVRDYQAASRRFTKMQAFRAIGYIREADARSKGIDYPNSSNEGDIWKELIYKIMH